MLDPDTLTPPRKVPIMDDLDRYRSVYGKDYEAANKTHEVAMYLLDRHDRAKRNLGIVMEGLIEEVQECRHFPQEAAALLARRSETVNRYAQLIESMNESIAAIRLAV